jgi:hypothetical protein
MTKNVIVSAILGLSALQVLAVDPAPAPAVVAAIPAASGPKIQFAEPVYDFGKVKSGDPVKHTFVFTNIGTETLILTNVQPSCGCTTAGDWSHQVEPGQTGTVPVQFNSANYNGAVVKTINVTSNDKGQPMVTLQLKGTIWKPIEVNPPFAVINLSSESTSGSIPVHIVNNMDEEITLSAPEISNPNFSVELKTNKPGKDFEMLIKVVPPKEGGNAQAQITLKTSSTNVPSVGVTAWANVQPVIVVSPPQISLPQAPLHDKQNVSVMIQNNGTNNIILSDPVVNVPGVTAKINDTQPGKLFTVMMEFPEGFEIPAGTKGELTIKSSHPKNPEVKVGIIQIARGSPPPKTANIIPLLPPKPTPITAH